MFIVAPSDYTESLHRLVDAAIEGGCDAIQLRARHISPSDMRDTATELRRVVDHRATLIVNNYPALAADLGLGLHLPETGVAIAEARRQVGSTTMIGRSVHSPAAATAATGADYLLAGHVYATRSKPGLAPLGLPGFRRIMESTWQPVLAVGGITAERIPSVVESGAAGIAVVSAIAQAANPQAAAAALRSALDGVLPREDQVAASTTVSLLVNGSPVTIEAESTITDFLADRGLAGRMVVVELNGQVIARRAFDDVVLNDGDRVEVVHAVGGG